MSRVMDLFREAGLPDGVVNLVHGDASSKFYLTAAVQHLLKHPGIAGFTFVGTSRVAEIVSHSSRTSNRRVIALGGAKNHLVAAQGCNVEMASSDIVASFTGCAGQWFACFNR